MRILVLTVVMALLLVAVLATPAFAVGRPNQECEPDPTTGLLPVPGFNTSGFANASEHYAGEVLNPNQSNPAAKAPASQYDVACFGGHRS